MKNDLTAIEAIQAMKEGKKVTHRFMSEHEWVKQYDGYHYEFEDGCKPSIKLFWSDRRSDEWKKGWSIIES